MSAEDTPQGGSTQPPGDEGAGQEKATLSESAASGGEEVLPEKREPPAEEEERPSKKQKRVPLDEVPLMHTYTSDAGCLYVYDCVDEDWKDSDVYEALLEAEAAEEAAALLAPEGEMKDSEPLENGEGMTREEQDAALKELFEEAAKGGSLGAGPMVDIKRRAAKEIAAEKANETVAAAVAKAKESAQPGEPDDPDKEAKRQKRREYRERRKLKQQAGLFIKAKENPNVYVSGLPEDITAKELEPLFKKAGVLKLDVETCASKIRIYTGQDGRCKGDALVTFANAASVQLAVKFLHEYEIRPGCRICVQQADFEEVEKKNAKLSKEELKELATSRKPDADRAKYIAAKNGLKEAVSWSGEMDDGTGRRIVILKHMFSPEEAEKEGAEFYTELAQEVQEECEKIGQVLRVTPIEQHLQGIVCVKFKVSAEAEECIRVMDGRYFGGRTVEAAFYDGKSDLKAFGVKSARKAKAKAEPKEAPHSIGQVPSSSAAPGDLNESDMLPQEAPEETADSAPGAAEDVKGAANKIQEAYDAMFEDQSSDDEELMVRTE